MPPIRNKNKAKSLEIEGKIELAILALENKEIASIHEAAWLYNIPHSTLSDQLKDHPSHTILRANSHQLTEAEEEILIQWVLDLAKQGLPPRPAFIENMANHLLAVRDPTSSSTRVGKNWVSNLIKRRTE